jgi:hypothetical protein
MGFGQPRALAEGAGPLESDRQVAVAEVEPHVDPEVAQPVHHLEGVVAQAPAALVDEVGQPERHQVGIGRDVGAVDLDVIAGVGDDDQIVGAHHVEHAACELCAAGAAGEHDDGAVRAHASGRPVILIPARVL